MMNRHRIILSLLLAGLLGNTSGAAETLSPLALGVQNVRVAILKDVPSITIRVRRDYQILDPQTERVLDEGERLPRTAVLPTDRGIKVGGREFALPRIVFVAKKDVIVYQGTKEREFRGRLEVVRQKTGALLVINHIDLEDYTRGVLYHETSHRWPLEALKAQAVATRTYALYQIQQNAKQDYDVTSGIYSQVYGGRSSERYRTNMAVRKTSGRIMVYQGKVLPAYFSANCGGMTEDVTQLWNYTSMPPLRGVQCGFCKAAPHAHWKKNYRLKDIQDQLNRNGYDLDLIKSLEVAKRNRSGRVQDLMILTRDGKKTLISGKKFRDIIGPNVVKSTKFDVVMKGYYFDLIGQGWGHGVGMCQWGACEMARRRYDYPDILQFYYPGSQLVDCRDLKKP